MIDLEEKKNKLLFREICQGFSRVDIDKEKVYIKHFGDFDFGHFEEEFFYFLEKAKRSGLPTYEEKLDILYKNKDWSKDYDADIEYKKSKIKRLEKIHSELFLKSQIERSRVEIKTLKEEVEKKEKEKKDIIGMYAESFAQNKLEYIYILNSLYKDPDLKENKFQLESDDVDRNEYNKYILYHNKVIEKFNLLAIKKIAFAEFFQNLIGLAEQDAFYFYQKPIYKLTYYQMSIFSYGKFFYHALGLPEARKLDEDTKKDPEKLMDWYNATIMFKTKHKDSGTGMSFVMGAQEGDLEYLNQTNKGSQLDELAKSKGGTLNMTDLANFFRK